MKLSVNKIFAVIVIIAAISINILVVIKGNGKEDVTFIPMTAKAYCDIGTTADGSYTRKGICAAKPEWIGLTAAIYLNDNGQPGKFLGYYEIKDTGGRSIRNGKVIDIWLPTYDECITFGKKSVLVVLIKGVG